MTVSPPVVNLGLFSRPIKASIAYFYPFPGDRLTFLPFDTSLCIMGICTLIEHNGIEPLLSAYQTDFLPLEECSKSFPLKGNRRYGIRTRVYRV